MRIRNTSGAIISPNRASIAEAFPEPGPRLVVLVHGLGDTEQVWNRKGLGDHSEDGLADILTDNSFTPLLVRYNTGLGVARNALALANLSDEFVEAWPLAVENISFIGHSMGGLVARSALSAGNAAGHNWTQWTIHIVTLGSPHLGVPLEKGVHLAAAGLAQTPESRPKRTGGRGAFERCAPLRVSSGHEGRTPRPHRFTPPALPRAGRP